MKNHADIWINLDLASSVSHTRLPICDGMYETPPIMSPMSPLWH